MIAKLIVHGDTREQALARLDEALAQTHIVGLSTNVQFLRHVVRSPSFAQANLDTGLIPREQAVLFDQEPVGLQLAAAAAVAQALIQERASEGADPFSRRDGWTSHGVAVRRFAFEFRGVPGQAELTYLHDGALKLTVDNFTGMLAFSATPRGIDLDFAGQRVRVSVYADGENRPCVQRARRHPDPGDRPAGPCRRIAGRNRPAHRADAGQGAVVRRQGRRQGQQGPDAGGDGGDEDGAHHRRARPTAWWRNCCTRPATRWTKVPSC